MVAVHSSVSTRRSMNHSPGSVKWDHFGELKLLKTPPSTCESALLHPSVSQLRHNTVGQKMLVFIPPGASANVSTASFMSTGMETFMILDPSISPTAPTTLALNSGLSARDTCRTYMHIMPNYVNCERNLIKKSVAPECLTHSSQDGAKQGTSKPPREILQPLKDMQLYLHIASVYIHLIYQGSETPGQTADEIKGWMEILLGCAHTAPQTQAFDIQAWPHNSHQTQGQDQAVYLGDHTQCSCICRFLTPEAHAACDRTCFKHKQVADDHVDMMWLMVKRRGHPHLQAIGILPICARSAGPRVTRRPFPTPLQTSQSVKCG